MRYMISAFMIIVLMGVTSSFAATYYIKIDGNDGLDGLSDDTAWKTVDKVNGYGFQAGDDVYFKCGGTWTEQQLIVDWSGTSGDYAVIGAYYGSGIVGVSGDKPVLDGNDVVPDAEYQGLVWSLNQSYVRIENMNLVNSEYDGVRIGYGNHINAENVDVSNCFNAGIIYVYSHYGEIDDCVIDDANRRVVEAPGTDWSSGISMMQKSTYLTVKNCTVRNNYGEGIVTGSESEHNVIEYNTIYNNRRVAIYIDNGRYCTIRYNMVYGAGPRTTTASNGIGVDVEGWQSTAIGSDNYVYGNFIANCHTGIYLASWHDDSSIKRYYVYNNTVVDCIGHEIVIWDGPYEDSEVKNNIFWCISGDCALASVPDTDGKVAFDYNLWSGTPDADARGSNDPAYEDPLLAKTGGWSDLTPGSLTMDDFKVQSGSPAIDKGLALGASYATDYFGTARPQGAGWDIGAHEYGGTASSPVCGDSVCNGDEDCSTCPDDCGACPATSCTVLTTASAPVIDGVISEFSEADPVILTDTRTGTQGEYRLLYDNSALYIAASVADTQLAAVETDDGPLWEDDCIELMFDMNHDAGTQQLTDDFKFFVNLLNAHMDSRAADTVWDGSYTSAVTINGTLNQTGDTDQGYTLELAIPWSTLGVTAPQPGDVVGFELALNDRSDAGIRTQTMLFNLNGGSDVNDPDGWGDLVFDGSVSVTGDDRLAAIPVGTGLTCSGGVIHYGVAEAGHVLLNVYDCRGKVTLTLVNRRRAAGVYEVKWDMAKGMSDGVYVIKLSTDKGIRTTKAVFVR